MDLEIEYERKKRVIDNCEILVWVFGRMKFLFFEKGKVVGVVGLGRKYRI